MRVEAIEYIRANFLAHSLWGFKDPRTLRLFPFWSQVFQRLELEDAYAVVIRNPLSIAESLIARQPDVFDPATAHGLWLVHMVPYLRMIAHKPFVVTDYDLLMDDPRGQLERIGRALEIPTIDRTSADIEGFAAHFIDPELRHSQFGRRDRDFVPHLSLLVQKAYLCLRRLATDRIDLTAPSFGRNGNTLKTQRGDSLTMTPPCLGTANRHMARIQARHTSGRHLDYVVPVQLKSLKDFHKSVVLHPTTGNLQLHPPPQIA